MENTKILLVEDNANCVNTISKALHEKGYECITANNADKALTLFYSNNISLSIINTTLAGKDGFTLAGEIKTAQQSAAVIFLSQKNDEREKIQAFNIGADDFVVKPFFTSELVLRIEAVIRRATLGISRNNIFTFSNFTFNYNRQLLTYSNPETKKIEERKLTYKESDLLKILCLNINQIVGRTTILHKVWKKDTYFNARSMDVYITKLRKYLSCDSNVEILNQHGIGFKLAYS